MQVHQVRIFTTILALLACEYAGAASMRGHAIDHLALPESNSESTAYAADVDGDGTPENQFGGVLAIIASFGIDLSAETNAAIASGQIVNLVELLSSDATFTNDAAAQATWYLGQAALAPPLFNGTDTFRYDPLYAGAVFGAPLAAHVFASPGPTASTLPQFIALRIRIGSQTVALPLLATRIAFTTTASGLASGRLNGTVRKEDVDNLFVPALVVGFNEAIQADPQSATATTLLAFFDKSPTDGAISVAEVSGNALFGALLAPDVSVRGTDGNFVDALSFGCGFTAVASKTILPRIFGDGFE